MFEMLAISTGTKGALFTVEKNNDFNIGTDKFQNVCMRGSYLENI